MANASVRTRFTDMVGCALPIQSAAMGGVTTPELAGAVATGGGLGMLAGAALSPDELSRQITRATHLGGTQGQIGVGFLMPFLDHAGLEVAVATVRLIEFFYADPDPALVELAQGGGALVAWQVGSSDEAKAALDAGCDVIVAQGVEAGGHIHGTTPLDTLVAQVRPLTDAPLVAAGGIGTGERAVALLAQGADAVRIGTRFLATIEADVHPGYAAALIDASADDTVVTETFAMAWPHAPHRVLASSISASDAEPSMRLPIPPTRAFQGDVASAALYAGCSVDAVTEATTVGAVMAEFTTALTTAGPRSR